MRLLTLVRPLMLTFFIFFFSSIAINAQTTAFTYQGKLTDNTSVGNGTYDLQFALYDALTGGNQVGTTQTHTGVILNRGIFTVDLDFGSQFPGADRWLEISVKKPSDSSYTTLLPRQKISSVPYAVRALSAATADSLSSACVGCVTDSQINTVSGSKVTGTVANATNAATATTASTATNATNAATASSVSSSAGDSIITAINAGSSTINASRLPSTLATQNGTNTFSGTNSFSAGLSAGSQRITSVGTPTAASDAATKAYVDANVTSSTAGGHLTGTYPNPSIATTSSAGTNIVAAVNASAAAITTSHVSGDVELLPSATQTATQTTQVTRPLIDVKLVGTDNLGTSGQSDLLSLSAIGTYKFYTGATPEARDRERFRVDNTGAFAAFGDQDIGSIPAEGSGTRFMWLPYKGAVRGGYVDGTQWDDANIGYWSTAFGNNARASGDYGFAAGQNVVAANSWSVAMGQYVTASGAASVGLGYYAHTNSRQGSFVFSDRSVLDDGNFVTDESFKATVAHSFNVRATGGYWLFTNTGVSTGLRLSHLSTNVAYGSFVWSDRSSDSSVTPTAQNQTIFRSSGGYWLYSDSGLSTGVTLAPGSGAWQNVSDRNMKDNFKAVNPREILRGVLALPISTWNYKTQDASIRHIGAMAQDFKAAFKVGEDDKHISTIDPDGVALAAIQGLNEELKDELKTRDVKIERLETQLKQQQAVIEGMKKLLCANNPTADVCK
ncbi:MAG TPA: tail fiber domain-containing protein [Pyrinomonadaceae bacterium]|jgi:hypothetical protein